MLQITIHTHEVVPSLVLVREQFSKNRLCCTPLKEKLYLHPTSMEPKLDHFCLDQRWHQLILIHQIQAHGIVDDGIKGQYAY